MSTGSGGETLINVVLWLFGWFPGVIHSLAVTYTPFSFTGVGKARAAGGQAMGGGAARNVGGPGSIAAMSHRLSDLRHGLHLHSNRRIDDASGGRCT